MTIVKRDVVVIRDDDMVNEGNIHVIENPFEFFSRNDVVFRRKSKAAGMIMRKNYPRSVVKND